MGRTVVPELTSCIWLVSERELINFIFRDVCIESGPEPIVIGAKSSVRVQRVEEVCYQEPGRELWIIAKLQCKNRAHILARENMRHSGI